MKQLAVLSLEQPGPPSVLRSWLTGSSTWNINSIYGRGSPESLQQATLLTPPQDWTFQLDGCGKPNTSLLLCPRTSLSGVATGALQTWGSHTLSPLAWSNKDLAQPKNLEAKSNNVELTPLWTCARKKSAVTASHVHFSCPFIFSLRISRGAVVFRVVLYIDPFIIYDDIHIYMYIYIYTTGSTLLGSWCCQTKNNEASKHWNQCFTPRCWRKRNKHVLFEKDECLISLTTTCFLWI